MAQVGNNENRLGGQYMVQDSDHMSEINQPAEKANRGNTRQADQSQSEGRQQGSDRNNDQRRQNH